MCCGMKWLGHISQERMNRLVRDDILLPLTADWNNCLECIKSKKRLALKNNFSLKPKSFGNNSYWFLWSVAYSYSNWKVCFISFIDDIPETNISVQFIINPTQLTCLKCTKLKWSINLTRRFRLLDQTGGVNIT